MLPAWPLQCDEPEDFSTFRLGLFGLDKLNNIERTVNNLEKALVQGFVAPQEKGVGFNIQSNPPTGYCRVAITPASVEYVALSGGNKPIYQLTMRFLALILNLYIKFEPTIGETDR